MRVSFPKDVNKGIVSQERQRDLRIRHWTAPEKDIHLNGHRLCLPGTCIQRQGGVLYALENFVTSFGKEALMLRQSNKDRSQNAKLI